ncbi:XrtA/PEP-CTERM system histidine kinase PrsK [Alishewanella jeotgali]|uniref:histidine kinase n=1 Tax=Alishewanella jeotgali KCTC 22429 TaxID=1129374 RepID=H3ZBB4_9ALTE|nr:XrtA/PEP-CTERM system histidine kinase PrsK [Alishewanella jeotgali]EHR42228.1 sensor signal transduction histidine kinase [Alishewanella jeotgali KCTC 22429]
MSSLFTASPEQIGFAIAALAYSMLLLLLLTTRKTSVPKLLLLAYTAGCISWALWYTVTNAIPYSGTASKFFEWLRQLLLILFLLAALQLQNSLKQFLLRPHVILALGLALAWMGLAWLLPDTNSLLYTGSLAFCIIQLALLETLYRKASVAERWQFKPLVIALGATAVFDFVLLAESALFARIDMQLWQARGFVFALLVPVLTLSIRRIKVWEIEVYISRDVVLQSTLVLAAGIYLCLLALTGFYLRYIGGSWSELLQTSFMVLGFVLMLLLLFSGTVRRKLKVFIEKHFFANRFDYREQWLKLTQGLRQVDLNQPNRYQQILSVWLESIHYQQGALLQFQTPTQIKVLALLQRPAITESEQQLLYRYYQQHQADAWQLDLNQSEESLTAGLERSELKFQLLMPIRTKSTLWGVCLMQSSPGQQLTLNWELRDYLSVVSEQIVALLQLIQSSDKLSENAQFAAFSRMSAFVLHDLKNVKAQLDLLLRNAVKHKHNPEFIEDSFTTLAAMQQRLDHMLAQLNSKQAPVPSARNFSVAPLLENVIKQRCSNKLPSPQLSVHSNTNLNLDPERFANIMFHLLDNAQHATAEDGKIVLDLDTTANEVIIVISDTGCGMTSDFIEQRLFRPFDTTKGNAGMGIGVYDAKNYIEQAGGSLSVSSEPGVGTTFTIKLPLHSNELSESIPAIQAQGL